MNFENKCTPSNISRFLKTINLDFIKYSQSKTSRKRRQSWQKTEKKERCRRSQEANERLFLVPAIQKRATQGGEA
jgi:hypothetical protein